MLENAWIDTRMEDATFCRGYWLERNVHQFPDFTRRLSSSSLSEPFAPSPPLASNVELMRSPAYYQVVCLSSPTAHSALCIPAIGPLQSAPTDAFAGSLQARCRGSHSPRWNTGH